MKKAWLVLAGIILIGPAGWSLVPLIQVRLRLHALKKEIRRTPLVSSKQKGGLASLKNWEAAFSEACRRTGQGRLARLQFSQTKGVPQLAMEWEGSPTDLLGLLLEINRQNLAGPVLRLNVRKTSGLSSHVQMTALFLPPNPGVFPAELKHTTHASIFKRDVFKSLWNETAATVPVGGKPNPGEEGRKKAVDAHLEEERKLQDEQEQRETRRREIEAGFALTGIVNNGKEALALVQSRQAGASTRMLRLGDALEEARVSLIDEGRGELQLEMAGVPPVILRLQP